MRCKNCGFETEGEAVCPICGGECAESDVKTENPENPENDGAQPEAPELKPSPASDKKLLIIITAVICAVMIACALALGAYLSALHRETRENVKQALIEASSASFASGYANGFLNGGGGNPFGFQNDDYQNNGYSSDSNVYNPYKGYQKIGSENPIMGINEEYMLGSCVVKLTECSLGENKYSTDPEYGTLTVVFTADNATGKELILNCPGGEIWDTETGGESIIDSIEYRCRDNSGGGNPEPGFYTFIPVPLIVPAGETATVTFVASAPKDSENVGINLNLRDDTNKLWLAGSFEAKPEKSE